MRVINGRSMPRGPRRPAERGVALVIVILVLLTLSALGTTMILNSQGDHLISGNERDAERALLASRAGLNYAFYLFEQGSIVPTISGADFNSAATAVDTSLNGSAFSGKVFDLSSVLGQGQLYRIQSTGTHNRANRMTELTFQIVPESFKYGYMALNEATLHNHRTKAGLFFQIKSTIFSNGTVSVPEGLTIDGTIVAADEVSIDSTSVVEGNVFAGSVDNDGSILGNVKTLTAVAELPESAGTWDRVDNYGTKYEWYAGHTTPGAVGGAGTIAGTTSSYTIQNNDEFRYQIFRRDGSLLTDPDVNVTQFVAPPKLDYAAMKVEADKNDPTYFTTMAAAITYLNGKKVVETIDGFDMTTIRVGTSSAPEFLYITDDFELHLSGTGGAEDLSAGKLAADGFALEGGIYVSGDFTFDENQAWRPSTHPAPPVWYLFKVNGLPYCYPAMSSHPEPASGTIADWTPDDTPAMTGGVTKLKIQSKGEDDPDVGSKHEGFSFINGVTYSEGETHLHHTLHERELIRFNGAELGYKLHNCDYFSFTYDPAVRCTRFLVADEGEAEVVSFREVR